jgi:hypothetical protein
MTRLLDALLRRLVDRCRFQERLGEPARREGTLDEDERWRWASESDDRFLPFRRRQPIYVGLVTALIAAFEAMMGRKKIDIAPINTARRG